MVISISSLEKEHHFKYTPHLVFEDASLETVVKEQCQKQAVPQEALHYGALYEKELHLGLEIPSKVQWIHPEVGYGLYTTSEIPAGIFVGEYTGLLCCDPPYYKMGNYRFHYPHLHTERQLSIDAEGYGNMTRFINHSFTPNLTILQAFHGGLYHVILVAAGSIKKGEHLTYNYGHSYWYLRGAPHLS